MNPNRYHPTNQRLTVASPSTPWSGLESEISRLFESALSDFATPAFNHRFPVDLYEDSENTYVRAELPGLERADIAVELADGFLTISGERRQTDGSGQTTGSFSLNRSIAVPESVANDQVKAQYEDGILTVTLPKREEAKRRKLSIDVK
jgi:HSP20 family protein